MLPIRDHNPTQHRPVVTRWLIGLNIAVYLLTLAQPGLALQLALYPREVMAGQIGPGLLSHMFVHAGLLHLGGNLLFLWIFGDNIEDRFGHPGFLAFYLACGLVAAGAHIIARPGSSVPMVGASGAIAGVMGSYLLLFPRVRVDVIAIFGIILTRFALPAWLVLLIWAGMQLLLAGAVTGEGGVAYGAHIGGFIAGLVLSMPLWLRQRRPRRPGQQGNQGDPRRRDGMARTRIPPVRRGRPPRPRQPR